MTNNRYKSIASLGLALLLVLITIAGVCIPKPVKADEAMDVIEISTAQELVSFANECKYDSFSYGVSVKLTADISVKDSGFVTIPYFNGTFDGGNHIISDYNVEYKGSDYGFFRYLGDEAHVYNLNVKGNVSASGSQKNIGGIAGVNYGIISGCTYSGKVSGNTAVGAIAGVNKAGASIVRCNSEADVSATNQTGGIAGDNKGLISNCISKSNVNTQELNSSYDVGGVDVGTLNITQRVVDRNDIGGIAGNSTGVISDSTNYGAVGYSHVGYNVGGIAGNQSGKIYNCTNEGSIYGRKDVGGIAGQAQPYIESEYLSDRIDQMQDSVNSISNTMSNLSSSVGDTSSEVNGYAENLTNKYKEDADVLSDSLKDVSDSLENNNPEASQYIDNINDALDKIDQIQGDDIILSDKQKEDINEQWKIIRDNITELSNSMTDVSDSVEDFVTNMSDQISKGNSEDDINGITNAVKNQMDILADSIDSISSQINNISNIASDTANTVIDDDSHIEDISSAVNAKETDGVIYDSVNRGTINGDINAGGIAGNMNLEYDIDPEYDLDVSTSTNVKIRTTVNVVLIDCINYGEVVSKKDCAGGIAGMQELGLIYSCEGYGNVKSETGDYAGGIAGNSISTISDSYSLCNVESARYTGGICGQGYSVQNCIAIPVISGDGEAKGSVAGIINSDGETKNNLFVNDQYGGIDDISYRGVAEPVTYEYVMSLDGIPDGFNQVTLVFKADDVVLGTRNVPYNSNIIEKDLPLIPSKEGYYSQWPADIIHKPVTQNMVVEAEYHYWVESLAGSETSDNGKALFLVEGSFYGDDELSMSRCDADGVHGNVIYAYSWDVQSSHDEKYESVTGHFYIPDSSGSSEIWYQDKDNNNWVKADSKKNGSYITATIPYEASFAVVHKKTNYTIYYVAGAVAACIVAAVVIGVKKKKRKKTDN